MQFKHFWAPIQRFAFIIFLGIPAQAWGGELVFDDPALRTSGFDAAEGVSWTWNGRILSCPDAPDYVYCPPGSGLDGLTGLYSGWGGGVFLGFSFDFDKKVTSVSTQFALDFNSARALTISCLDRGYPDDIQPPVFVALEPGRNQATITSSKGLSSCSIYFRFGMVQSVSWTSEDGFAPDLAVESVALVQNGEVNPDPDKDGIIDLVPGQPVVSTVGFSAKNLGSIDPNFSVRLCYQEACLDRILNFSSGSATTQVTFVPAGSGLQNLSASIQTVQGEKDTSNNFVPGRVRVVAAYKLIASVNGVPIPDAGDGMDIEPGVVACGKLPADDRGVPVEVICVNKAAPTTPVRGCKFLLDLSLGSHDGGHSHNLEDETRPFLLGTEEALSSFPTGRYLSVDSYGSTLFYTPPEVSGTVVLRITGTDPYGNFIDGPGYLFRVKINEELFNLSGAGATETHPGISITTDSHPGMGSYGTSVMQKAVEKLVAGYYSKAAESGENELADLKSQGATMIWGGLFDANWNGGVYGQNRPTPWVTPHCAHRDGTTIDLSIYQLDSTERLRLQDAAATARIKFTVPGERPQDTRATHWHGKL